MANRVEVTKLQDGPRYLIYHAYLESDGAAGDIDSFALIDPATEDMHGHTRFTLEDVTWGFDGFTGRLHFEYLVDDTLAWVLPGDTGSYVNFLPYGGLLDRSDTDGTGKLLFSTNNFDTAGNAGSLILKVRLS